jgi:hypothetical protein
MLSDDARKILAIVWHLHRHDWADYVKDIGFIVQRSGRDERRVRGALNELVKADYLEHKDGLTRVLWSSQLDREKQTRLSWKERY